MKCDICEREMATASGCVKHAYIHNKKQIRAIKCGGTGDWGEGDPSYVCHDCNAKYGEYHHPGCDTERCPVCCGQLISCNCFGNQLRIAYNPAPEKSK